jgi:transcriptional regulator with XRE-family HTH domain
MSTLENLRGLRAARKEKGLTQKVLALRTGLSQPEVSILENGGTSMSRAVAEKLAPVVGSTPLTLQIENRIQRLQAAKKRGDKAEVFNAAKSAVKLLDGMDLDATTEEALDKLVDSSASFTQSVASAQSRPSKSGKRICTHQGYFTFIGLEG